jgi:hypothetical protein
MAKFNKKNRTMNEVSKDYEAFAKGRETNPNNGDLFEALLKKAVNTKPEKSTKPRGSK